MTEITLKPCPFCEADAYLESGVKERDDRRYFSMTVCCGSCEATITKAINFTEYRKLGERGTYQRLMEMCSAAWNTRQAGAKVDGLLQDARGLLQNSGGQSGHCMCGDPVEGHGYDSGHSPVDSHIYYSNELIERIDAHLSHTNERAE